MILLDSGKIDNLYSMAGGFGGFKPTEVPLAFWPTKNTTSSGGCFKMAPSR